jgi:hypothetical protein
MRFLFHFFLDKKVEQKVNDGAIAPPARPAIATATLRCFITSVRPFGSYYIYQCLVSYIVFITVTIAKVFDNLCLFSVIVPPGR